MTARRRQPPYMPFSCFSFSFPVKVERISERHGGIVDAYVGFPLGGVVCPAAGIVEFVVICAVGSRTYREFQKETLVAAEGDAVAHADAAAQRRRVAEVVLYSVVAALDGEIVGGHAEMHPREEAPVFRRPYPELRLRPEDAEFCAPREVVGAGVVYRQVERKQVGEVVFHGGVEHEHAQPDGVGLYIKLMIAICLIVRLL